MGILSGFVRDYKGDLMEGATLHCYRRDTGAKIRTLTTSTGSTSYPNVDSNVVLLIDMSGSVGSTVFTDESLNTKVITNSNTIISSVQSKFAPVSARFSGAFLSVPPGPDFNFGSNPFTIEAWVYPITNGGSYTRGIFSQRDTGTFCPLSFSLSSSGAPELLLSNTAVNSWNSVHTFTGVTCSVNVWSHLALTGSGGVIRCFVNGVQASNTVSYSTIPQATTPAFIGRGGGDNFDGFMDGIRVINGEALYTSNFTPPTEPFLLLGGETMTSGGYYINTGSMNDECQIVVLADGSIAEQNDTIIRVTPSV